MPDCNSLEVDDRFYKSNDIFGYCLPKSIKDLPPKLQTGYQTAFATMKDSKAYEYIEDIKYCYTAIGICVVLAFVMNFLYIQMMSHYAEALAKLNVFIIEVILVLLIAYSFGQTKNPDLS